MTDILIPKSIYGDEFYTLRGHVEDIAKCIDLPYGSTVWCPFDKDESQFAIVLREYGYDVVNTHIDYGQDFFVTSLPCECKAIISNPPFSIKKQVMNRIKELDIPFAMLLPDLWLTSGVPFDYGNQMIWWRKRVHFQSPNGELDHPRNTCFVLSNGILKKDLTIFMDR